MDLNKNSFMITMLVELRGKLGPNFILSFFFLGGKFKLSETSTEF